MPNKFKKLKQTFLNKSVLVAYSGGMDSSALLYLLKDVEGINLTAVTVSGSHVPSKEFARAKKFCIESRINHVIIEAEPLEIEAVRCNDDQRCYYCKSTVFSILRRMAQEDNFDIIADGSNLSDISDYRPGMKALKELEVFSPFLEFEITKDEIREFLVKEELQELIHPSNACLISRVPYGIELNKEVLKKIDEAEEFIRSFGIDQVRCRYHIDIARIEVGTENIPAIIDNAEIIHHHLQEIGFKYITLDIKGYTTGGAN